MPATFLALVVTSRRARSPDGVHVPAQAYAAQMEDAQAVVASRVFSAAIDLAQQGVAVLLLDDDDRLSTGSRAICFAKRTLEIFDRLGCGRADGTHQARQRDSLCP